MPGHKKNRRAVTQGQSSVLRSSGSSCVPGPSGVLGVSSAAINRTTTSLSRFPLVPSELVLQGQEGHKGQLLQDRLAALRHTLASEKRAAKVLYEKRRKELQESDWYEKTQELKHTAQQKELRDMVELEKAGRKSRVQSVAVEVTRLNDEIASLKSTRDNEKGVTRVTFGVVKAYSKDYIEFKKRYRNDHPSEQDGL